MQQILIAEDQTAVRQGISRIISELYPNRFKLLEASNGAEGYALALSSSPQIILTDIMMPDMSGLDMIRLLREQGVPSAFIIMSAYKDFDYARQAVSYGVQEYLLKPVREKDLHASIEKATGKLDSNYSDLMLYDYFSGGDMAVDISTIPQYTSLYKMPHRCWMMVVFEYSRALSMQELAALRADLDAGFRAQGVDCVSFHNYSNRIAAVINLPSDGAEALERCVLAQPALRRGDWHAGLSACSEDVKHLKTLFRQAESALHQAIFGQVPCALFDESQHQFGPVVTKQRCEALAVALSKGDRNMVASLKDTIFADISSLCTSREMALHEFEKLVYYLSFHSGRLALREEEVRQAMGQLASAKTMLGLKAAINDLLAMIMQRYGGDSLAELERAIVFVRENYMRDINAATLANLMNMSYSYFCSYFTRKMGKTTSEYISDIRLEKARELLEKTNLRITDIARQCGFCDYRYFSRLFKRKYGHSPAAYQRR